MPVLRHRPKPTDKDLFYLISEIDIEGKNLITFKDFLELQIREKNKITNEVDQDVLNAFVALGGNIDMSGVIETEKIESILTEIFDNTFNFNNLFKNLESNKKSSLNFCEFKNLLNK